MLTYKRFPAKRRQYGREVVEREGWYLFGFIPLYVRVVITHQY